jgi:hypothetical protein
MATTGTYSFSPDLGSIFMEAFSRIGVKRPELTPQHLMDASLAANYQQIEWSNDGVLLWTVDLQTIPLVQGHATYTVPPNTVMILDLYINNGTSNRLIMPFSRTDYASLANPLTPGFPTSFWFDRLIAPTLSLWPVPDGSATYTMSYYRYRQIQDAVAQGGLAPEIQTLWLDAYAAGLAHRLSRGYAPALEIVRKADYLAAYMLAAKQGTENVPLYVSPGLQSYYRS